MAYVVWRVLVKQYSKVRLGVQRNSPLDEDVTPTARRTKSFDDNAWKTHDSSLNLSANIPAISSVALSSRCAVIDPESPTPLAPCGIHGNAVSCGGGLDDILVIESETEHQGHHHNLHHHSYSHGGTLSRGELRKSRSKMKSYLKRCKDALIGTQPTEDTCPITHHEAVVQLQSLPLPQQSAVQIPTANWYLDDQLCEIRPEDNREPYSSFATSRLREQQLEREKQAGHELGRENTAAGPIHELKQQTQSWDGGTTDSANDTGAAGSLAVVPGSEAHPSSLPVGINLSPNGIEKLIDQHFGPLYPDYVDHTRAVLIRQARDLLVCTFHGDLEQFEVGFVRPAADIVAELRSAYLQGKTNGNY
ncbi:uncharacterized protein LOC129766700 [Toxorhynchites rutilus septentrionalis]|uniref:uncharacterized protein LOC129766700 n=1 Tax=Toxorhynchites rutilus septentrionalis TaxID=329112 RepID=UPI00247AD44B|nr:uncharacterized protein LOC129766700 [Toxorhynchites rutilus septentrionalis]